MNKLLTPFKVIRNHWKKSLFFTCVGAYGANWANEYRKEELIRQSYSEKAREYGDRTIPAAFQKPESVLVLINRTSANNKAKTTFEKNCSPILHLAGFDLDIHDWEAGYDNESDSFLDNLLKSPQKPYSAVLIVGGNRSSNAYLRYAMSRSSQIPNLPPVALIPVGTSSLVMTRFIPLVGSSAYVERLCSVAFKVVEGNSGKVDVLRIETKKTDETETPTYSYALSEFSFDKITDMSARAYKYWYFPWATKRVFVGLIGLFMGDFNERIFGEIEAYNEERKSLPAHEAKPEPVRINRGWFSWTVKPEEPKPGEEVIVAGPKQAVKTGSFDADYVSMIANLPDKLGCFMVEVSTTKQGVFSSFGNAVIMKKPSVEETFDATDLQFTLNLIPRRASFHVDGVPHNEFDPVINISLLPRAFRMFY